MTIQTRPAEAAVPEKTTRDVLLHAALPAIWHAYFDGRYVVVGECWEWTGARGVNGYGHVGATVPTTAHRRSWELATGEPITAGYVVMHSCDNPPCIRPAHLRPATPSENTRDMVAKGRHGAATHPESILRGHDHPMHGSRWSEGERNRSARLTEVQVGAIRALRADGWTYVRLMRQFDVSKSTIAGIVRGRTWRHLPDSPGRTAAEVVAALRAAADSA